MKSKQRKAIEQYVTQAEELAEKVRELHAALEAIGNEVFLDDSTCGKANSEEVRLMNGGNDCLNQSEAVLREAVLFFKGATAK